MSENFYNILGISENSTKDEIKKAYRGLQMKYHPDKNPGSQEAHDMTQKINEAYETLGDDQKRQEYDMMRNNPFMTMDNQGQCNMDVPLNDIFNMMFGSNTFSMPGMAGLAGMPIGQKINGTKIHIFHGGPINMQQAMNKPIPIMKSLQITMEQVFSGASLPLEIERWVLQAGSKIFEKETIYVDIPQGIDENEILILRDRGNVISDTCKGDIKINISVQNNTAFKRAGLDLILDKTISLKEALCGFNFELKYINGKSYTLNNNKGSIVPPEYKKIYQGMGLKRGDHNGNMIINFHVDFPTNLTIEQIDKLIEIL
jgi:DnaJ-class molecular chaperone